MTGRRFVVWFARGAIIAFSLTAAFVGCSRQGEGERCVRIAAGDTDCDQDEGLRCVPCVELAEGIVDRCCPINAGSETDDRCRRSDPPRNPEECPSETATGGTGGASTGTGGTSTGGTSTGGTSTGGSGGSGAMSGGTAGTSGTGGESGAPDAAGAGGA